jgi:TRAP-type C4-dicarboxylate transport system permease small subunit
VTRFLQFCEFAAALLLGLAVVILAAVAFSRYVFGWTPVWTEPVLVILVLGSVCFAMAPGLSEGVHVSIHFAQDRLSAAARRVIEKIVWIVGAGLGVFVTVSGIRYAWDQWTIGLADYAGVPQWIPSLLASLFGVVLLLFSIAALTGKASRSR